LGWISLLDVLADMLLTFAAVAVNVAGHSFVRRGPLLALSSRSTSAAPLSESASWSP
jgi:hypothetical protein